MVFSEQYSNNKIDILYTKGWLYSLPTTHVHWHWHNGYTLQNRNRYMLTPIWNTIIFLLLKWNTSLNNSTKGQYTFTLYKMLWRACGNSMITTLFGLEICHFVLISALFHRQRHRSLSSTPVLLDHMYCGAVVMCARAIRVPNIRAVVLYCQDAWIHIEACSYRLTNILLFL